MSDRMVDQFMEMVRIDSESGEEAAMMDYLLEAFKALGGEASLDDYGNLLAVFPALGCEGKETILFSCHADTVKPGKGIEPVLEGGMIRSRGETILGADDKAGIAEVLEALRTTDRRPPVEFAISRQEEVGLLGVKQMDLSRITAKMGFLMDNDTLETIVVGGPSYFAIDVHIRGKAAHAGMEPEKGISAILAAARAITALTLGRIDEGTTANVGVIEGGLIRNGIPEQAHFLAECRSADHHKAEGLAQEMVKIIEEQVESLGAQVEIKVDNLCRAVSIPDDATSVRIAQQALATQGIHAKPIFITGFTDASIYNNQGIEMAVVGIGAQNEHSCEECIAVVDMTKAVAMVKEILRICSE